MKKIKYCVYCNMVVNEGCPDEEFYKEEFSGIYHETREAARKELVAAQNDPMLTGYTLSVGEVENG